MKSCPNCGSKYTDDTLSFCLSDGSRLADDGSTGAVTVVLGETDTVVRPGRAPEGGVTQISPIQAARPSKATSRIGLAVALTACGMLILFGVIAVVGFLIWRNYNEPSANAAQNREVVANTFDASPTPAKTTTTAKSPAVPTPLPTIAKTPTATPQTPKRASYPASVRLKMARGAFSVPFSGEINPGDERSFILACRAGQSLSATVNGGSCVTFSLGGSSISRTTVGGDNYVSVTNNCQTPSRFTGRISVR